MGEPFDPDWCSAPGETLLEVLKERMIRPAQFAARAGMTPELLFAVLNGEAVIDRAIADRLTIATGVTQQFWLGREQHFREGLAAGKVWASRESHLREVAKLPGAPRPPSPVPLAQPLTVFAAARAALEAYGLVRDYERSQVLDGGVERWAAVDGAMVALREAVARDETATRIDAAVAALNERIATAHERVACPKCGAPAGHQCVSVAKGRHVRSPLKHSHRERLHADGISLR